MTCTGSGRLRGVELENQPVDVVLWLHNGSVFRSTPNYQLPRLRAGVNQARYGEATPERAQDWMASEGGQGTPNAQFPKESLELPWELGVGNALDPGGWKLGVGLTRP